MDRREAIRELKFRRENSISVSEIQALDLAIEALERELEYGQMVVDLTKGETMKSNEWKYDTTCDAETATTTDCISRADLPKELNGVVLDDCDKIVDEFLEEHECDELWNVVRALRDFYDWTMDAPSITPTEQQEHGRLIDADKLLQELFIVDEEEWTTPEIRAILENAPTVITPTERTGEWIDMSDGGRIKYIWYEKYMCDKCGERGTSAWSFCPNCGAKMR